MEVLLEKFSLFFPWKSGTLGSNVEAFLDTSLCVVLLVWVSEGGSEGTTVVSKLSQKERSGWYKGCDGLGEAVRGNRSSR